MDFVDIGSMLKSELRRELLERSVRGYRADQICGWVAKGIESFDEMTDVPKSLRKTLGDNYRILGVSLECKFVSERDGTVKYLFRLFDGRFVESVLMKYRHGYSTCVSTQVGCKMNCAFCATGKSGFSRNLFPSEILAQIRFILNDAGIDSTNVVLMGMGEPLDNYANVIKFLRLVSAREGLNVGMRRISLSTCGIVDKIYSLADLKLQLTLSVSLHAPSDELRNVLVPVNRRWGLARLMEACRYYIDKTGRRISFEYAMIDGVNDGPEQALRLSRLLKGINGHVNLIPMNRVEGSGFNKSKEKTVEIFKNELCKKGVNATIRRTLGPDINASCGQLRRRMEEKGE